MNNNSKYININHNILINHIEVNTINIYITNFNNWKDLIPKNFFDVTDIKKDGNCLFRAIRQYFLGEENHHLYFRNIIQLYIIKQK